jgi:hypothetical protein
MKQSFVKNILTVIILTVVFYSVVQTVEATQNNTAECKYLSSHLTRERLDNDTAKNNLNILNKYIEECQK